MLGKHKRRVDTSLRLDTLSLIAIDMRSIALLNDLVERLRHRIASTRCRHHFYLDHWKMVRGGLLFSSVVSLGDVFTPKRLIKLNSVA